MKVVSVEPYLFFCLVSYIMREGCLHYILMQKVCLHIYNYGNDACRNVDTNPLLDLKALETAVKLRLGMTILSCFPAIGVAMFLGAWSDKYSRKYPMIISASGMLLEPCLWLILAAFPNASPYGFLVVAALCGFSGGLLMCSASALSYMAEITDESSRPTRYAVLEFSSMAALIIGQSITYKLGNPKDNASSIIPMLLSVLFAVLALMYVIVFVKETNPTTHTGLEVVKNLFTKETLNKSIGTYILKRPGYLRLQIYLLVWVNSLYKFVEIGTLSIETFFATSTYHLSLVTHSYDLIYYSIAIALVTVILVPALTKVLKLHEATVGVIGILSMMARLFLTSVAFKIPVFYIAWAAGSFNRFTAIAIRSRLSKVVSEDETGRVFSLLASFESVMPILGGLTFQNLLSVSQSTFLGLPFLSAAFALGPALFIFIWMMKMPVVCLEEAAIADDKTRYSTPLETIASNYYEFQEEKSNPPSQVTSDDSRHLLQ